MPRPRRNSTDGVAAERHESPEHERVGQAGGGTLDDRLPLADDVDEKSGDSESEVIEGKRVGSGRDQADACRDLRGKRPDEDDDEQPEQQRCHGHTNHGARGRLSRLINSSRRAVSAGTISNRSPTMP